MGTTLRSLAAIALTVVLAGCGESNESKKSEARQSVANFNKYMTKSRAVEANLNVTRLLRGARDYYENAPHAAAPQFPAPSVSATPPVGTCCKQGGQCAPDAKLWESPTWRALRFAIDDAHTYSYSYDVDDAHSSVTVRAIGDIDCDGVTSTFEIRAQVRNGQVIDPGVVTKIRPEE